MRSSAQRKFVCALPTVRIISSQARSMTANSRSFLRLRTSLTRPRSTSRRLIVASSSCWLRWRTSPNLCSIKRGTRYFRMASARANAVAVPRNDHAACKYIFMPHLLASHARATTTQRTGRRRRTCYQRVPVGTWPRRAIRPAALLRVQAVSGPFTAPGAEAPRPNSTGAASCCLHLAPAVGSGHCGKQHAALSAARPGPRCSLTSDASLTARVLECRDVVDAGISLVA